MRYTVAALVLVPVLRPWLLSCSWSPPKRTWSACLLDIFVGVSSSAVFSMVSFGETCTRRLALSISSRTLVTQHSSTPFEQFSLKKPWIGGENIFAERVVAVAAVNGILP